MDAVREVFAVVHTASRHHDEGLVGGWYDSELSAAGVEQAERTAAALRRSIPDGAPCRVYSSDLRRAVQTAEAIASSLGVDLVRLPGLRELSYGVAEGRSESWLQERYVPAPPEDRLDHDGGIEGAETKRAFATRVYDAMDRILAEDFRHQVVVTHGFALTFVVMAWVRVPVEHTGWVNLRSTPGGITHLAEDDHFRNRAVRALDSTAHLAG